MFVLCVSHIACELETALAAFGSIISGFHLLSEIHDLNHVHMSIASSSSHYLNYIERITLWGRMRRDLHAFGVPTEAWPKGSPSIYHSYTVRRRAFHGRDGLSGIQVWIAPERYYVLRPPGSNHGVPVDWNGDADGAWERAKGLAGWE